MTIFFSLIYFLFLILTFQISTRRNKAKELHWVRCVRELHDLLNHCLQQKKTSNKHITISKKIKLNYQCVHAGFDLELSLTCRQPVTKC